MPINYTIFEEEGYLLVSSAGTCENLNELKEYVMAMHNAAISSGLERILVDQTQLEFKLSTFNSFDSGRFISSLDPKPIKLAVLINLEGWDDAKFWETVSVNRGVPVQIFIDKEAALTWIMD